MTQVLQPDIEHQQELRTATPACSGRTELFFSERTADMRSAQVICSGCSVRTACLEEARLRPPFAGVWGGVIFVNGEEQLLKRGRGRPSKSEQLDNARVLKALAVEPVRHPEEHALRHPEERSDDGSLAESELVRHIA